MNPHDINPSDLPSVPFVEKNRLPSSMAIYFVMNALGEILYIGQTINLNQRWNSHQLLADLKSQEGIRIAWLLAESELELGFEPAFIKCFDPPLNINIVKGLRDCVLAIRVPAGLKTDFFSWCKENKTTPSKRMRELIDLDIEEIRAEEQANPSP